MASQQLNSDQYSQTQIAQDPSVPTRSSILSTRVDLRALAWDLSTEASAHNATRLKLQYYVQKMLQYEQFICQERATVTAIENTNFCLQSQLKTTNEKLATAEGKLEMLQRAADSKIMHQSEAGELPTASSFTHHGLPDYQSDEYEPEPAIERKRRRGPEDGMMGKAKRVKHEGSGLGFEEM